MGRLRRKSPLHPGAGRCIIIGNRLSYHPIPPTIENQKKIAKVFLGLVFFAAIVALSLYAQSKIGAWYQEHQLLCLIISSGIGVMFLVVFGMPWQNACTKVFDKISNFFVRVLIFFHIFKNRTEVIYNIDQELSIITNEIGSILSDIEAKVKIN